MKRWTWRIALLALVGVSSSCGSSGGEAVESGAQAGPAGWQETIASTNGGKYVAASEGKVLVGAREIYERGGAVAQADWFRIDAETGTAEQIRLPFEQATVGPVVAVYDGFLVGLRPCQEPAAEPGACSGTVSLFFLSNRADTWAPVTYPAELSGASTPTIFPVTTAAPIGDGTVIVTSPTFGSDSRSQRMALRWADDRLSVIKDLDPEQHGTKDCIAGTSLVSLAQDGRQIYTEDLTGDAPTETTAVPEGVDTRFNTAPNNLGCTDEGGFLLARSPGVDGAVTLFPLAGGQPEAVTAITPNHDVVTVTSSPSQVVVTTIGRDEPNRNDGAVRITSELDQQKLPAAIGNSYLTTDGATGTIYAVGPTEAMVIAGEVDKGYNPADIKIQEV